MPNLKIIQPEQAFYSISVLQDIEPKDEEERQAIDCAVSALQILIKRFDADERKRANGRAYYNAHKDDPEYIRKRIAKDKRYRETHREQINAKNRRYKQRCKEEALL